MGKFARSWALTRASMAVLQSDKELLVFPLLSTAGVILVVLSFALPMFGLGLFDQLDRSGAGAPPVFYACAFAFYLAQYFVVFFFNSALVGAAMIRLDGGDPTVADGLRIARGKWPQILGYAAIAATVGMVLRALEQRAGFVGRIVAGLVGVAWTLATFMTVPVLVARDIGPVDAVKESATLLKRAWGENLIGKGGLGIVFGLLSVVVIVLGAVIAVGLAGAGLHMSAILAGVLAVIAVLGISLIQSALSGIYSAALYRYAVSASAPDGFDGALLQAAFQPKK